MLSPAPARQGAKGAPKAKLILVNDRAELFSAGAVRSADETVKEIHRKFKKTLAIETYKSAPEGKTSASIHCTFVAGKCISPLANDPIEVRLMGLSVNGTGAFKYLYNVQPTQRKEFGVSAKVQRDSIDATSVRNARRD